MRLDVLDLKSYSFLMNSVPDRHTRTGVLGIRADALDVSSPKPIDDTFVVHMSRGGSHRRVKESQESCQLSSLDGTLYHNCSIQGTVQPMHWPILLVVIHLHL